MGFGGSQNKNNMRGWFLEGLEESVRGAGTKHVDFVDDVDLVACLVGCIVDLLTETADIVDASVAGSVNFDDIQSAALGYCLTHGAGIAGFTVAIGETIYRLSQNARGAGLAGSPRATKKIGMRYTAAAESIEQCLCYRFLANYFS